MPAPRISRSLNSLRSMCAMCSTEKWMFKENAIKEGWYVDLVTVRDKCAARSTTGLDGNDHELNAAPRVASARSVSSSPRTGSATPSSRP